ncbi:MAG: cell division protein FtsL [Desulfobacteraceae bacterium]|nr:cell division protein FtsL [Desulfobacteraceae bacterium]
MNRARETVPTHSMKPGSDFSIQQKESVSAHIGAWLVSALFLGSVFVMCAIFYVWLYAQQVQDGYHLAKIYEENELQRTVQRKLKLEWSRFRDPTRLEEIGQKEFGLAPPRPDQQILVR